MLGLQAIHRQLIDKVIVESGLVSSQEIEVDPLECHHFFRLPLLHAYFQYQCRLYDPAWSYPEKYLHAPSTGHQPQKIQDPMVLQELLPFVPMKESSQLLQSFWELPPRWVQMETFPDDARQN